MGSCSRCNEDNQERARYCWSCGAALIGEAVPQPEARKTVTVVFCDITGSTALAERLDPESLHAVMTRYYLRMREVLERHGGTVREFLGDGVMAVFGVPVVHEDDPLRAIRASVEMVDEVQTLNLKLEQSWGVTIQVHTGVNTGEVVAGDPLTSDTLVVGDAVNVASRLENAAAPGEILLGATTYQLVRDAVHVEPVGPLTLKGKGAPVPAWRLVRIIDGRHGHLRQLDSPIAGRREELTLLEQAFHRAVRERRCFLFTLLGSAGVGKSRLVAEFLAQAERHATGLIGRCLSYGEGITFWPIGEVVRQAGGLLGLDTPETALGKLDALMEGEEQASLITEPLAGAIGLVDGTAVAEEITWAIRKLFETLARRRPLVVVFDDLQWAESTFLDLVEHVADWSHDAPILLICVARPEFLDSHPHWAGGKLNATSILLGPLSAAESERVVGNLLTDPLAEEARTRIIDAAEGNPLFIEEFLRMLIDDGLLVRSNSQWVPTTDFGAIPIPATIQALLAARLDQLVSEERAILQRASVVGKVFDQGAIAELSSPRSRPVIGELLMALVRKELIHPHNNGITGGSAFRFRHDLIRDAAYESLPKQHRAELHEHFANWLEHRVGDRLSEYEEILGYHLEQAYRLRAELGPIDERTHALAQAASVRLGTAGHRAFDRSDPPAACNLLRRALALLSPQDPSLGALRLGLGKALVESGGFEEADAVLAEAIATSREERVARLASLERLWLQVMLYPEQVTLGDMQAKAETSITAFTKTGDDQGLCQCWRLLIEVYAQRCQLAAATEAAERAVEHARRAGGTREEGHAVAFLGLLLDCGPMPVVEALKRCRTFLTEARSRRWAANLMGPLAHLEAMQCRFTQARDLIRQGRAIAGEFPPTWMRPGFGWWSGRVEFLAGDLIAAERELRLGYGIYQQMGEKNILSAVVVDLAEVLALQGRYGEALRLTEVSQAAAGDEDLWSHSLWHSARAKVLAWQGSIDEAERLAQEAIHLTAEMDFPESQAGALLALAEVRRLTGHPQSARALLNEAAQLYQQKGNQASLESVHDLLRH
jgi:class 3 adenylate cyclase/tetratricopeptide (TPR) repeat protein